MNNKKNSKGSIVKSKQIPKQIPKPVGQPENVGTTINGLFKINPTINRNRSKNKSTSIS